MKRKWISSWTAAVLLTTAACAADLSPVPSPTPAAVTILPVLRKAPQWVLKDLDGHEVRSADFKGKVVVVDFWATWCVPCRHEIPDYVALQKKYADRGLVILGFSLDELPAAEVKRVGETLKMNYPILAADGATAELFGDVVGLPTAFLIDREGNIRHIKLGLTAPGSFEKLIVSLL